MCSADMVCIGRVGIFYFIMAKDPAFLFYPNDFTSGTRFFTNEQLGKYIRLLCAQFDCGHLSEEDMLFICKSYDIHIFSKFIKDSEGKYYNERLEKEKFKRSNFCKSRSKNRASKNDISFTYEQHMENENENVNIIDNKDKEKGGVGGKENLPFNEAESLARMRGNEVWREQICLMFKISAVRLDELIETFSMHRTTTHATYTNHREFVSHFTNWYRRYLEGQKKNNPTKHGKGGRHIS